MHNNQTSFSSSQTMEFTQIKSNFQKSALKHFMQCANFNQLAAIQTKTQSFSGYYNEVPNSAQISSYNELEIWLSREKIMKQLKNLHLLKTEEYVKEMQDLMTMSPEEVNKRQQKEMVPFIQSTFPPHAFNGFAAIILKLLEYWGLLKNNEDILVQDQIESYGIFEIQKQISKIREQIESASALQHSIVKHYAIDNYMSRITAISTLGDRVDSRSIRSTILKQIKEKPRFMMHIGGVILNLMSENISKIGRNVDVIDLKGEYQDKSQMSLLSKPTAFMGVCSFGNKVFVSGGRNAFGQLLLGEDDSQEVKDQMLMITPSNHRVVDMMPMATPRSHHGMVSYKGYLYAIGGSNGKNPVDSVERFDVINNKWEEGTPMPSRKSCACSVVHNDQIWVIGGRNEEGKILDEIFSYDNQTNLWTHKPSLPVPLMLSSAISIDSKLFVVGGVTGTRQKPEAISEIYTFNDTFQRWETWTKMSHSRMNHSTSAYGNYLIVVGGHTMHNLIPQQVPEAICFSTSSQEEISQITEYTTPMLGSSKIGLGVAMFGDPRVLDNVCIRKTSNNRSASMSIVESDSLENQKSAQVNFIDFITDGYNKK